jgi:hypothetical protein
VDHLTAEAHPEVADEAVPDQAVVEIHEAVAVAALAVHSDQEAEATEVEVVMVVEEAMVEVEVEASLLLQAVGRAGGRWVNGRSGRYNPYRLYLLTSILSLLILGFSRFLSPLLQFHSILPFPFFPLALPCSHYSQHIP